MVQAVQTWQTKLKLMLFHGGSSTDAWFTMTAAQVRRDVGWCRVLCQCKVVLLRWPCVSVAGVVPEAVEFMLCKQRHTDNGRQLGAVVCIPHLA